MKRHPFDPFSLIFGLTFAALGGVLATTDFDVADLAGGGWIPLPLVILGLVLLAVGLDRARPSAGQGPPSDAPSEDVVEP